MSSRISSRRVVVVSFVVDLLDVVTNLVVALLTGSAVVFSEMAQGVADSLGSAMLVIGERRAALPRDAAHPLGYAREAFFWGLLSAIAMLVVGAGLSAWRGYHQLIEPEPLGSPWLAVAVLALAVVTNSYALSLSVRKLATGNGGLLAGLRNFNRPLVKGALLRDAIGTSTSVIGLVALLLCQSLDLVIFDALGAIVAALMLLVGSLFLMTQARALITGRALPESEITLLRAAILAIPEVEAVNRMAAIYAGASNVLIDADLDLREDLDTSRIEAVLDDVEAHARTILPNVERVRVMLNSPECPSGDPSQPAAAGFGKSDQSSSDP